MTEKELRWARKSALRSIIDEQSALISALKEENEWLRRNLTDAEAQLEDRTIRLSKAGSLADASLEINQMFSTAQNTANLYLENIKIRKEEQEALCQKLETESREKADKLMADTKEAVDLLMSDAKKRSEEMIHSAREESQAYWDSLRAKLDAFYEAHLGLREMLNIPNAAEYLSSEPVFTDIDEVLGTSDAAEEPDVFEKEDFEVPVSVRLVE